jgi:hypothetical protein
MSLPMTPTIHEYRQPWQPPKHRAAWPQGYQWWTLRMLDSHPALQGPAPTEDLVRWRIPDHFLTAAGGDALPKGHLVSLNRMAQRDAVQTVPNSECRLGSDASRPCPPP